MCVPCGRPWFKHGHAASDYDPDSGLLRDYAGQAETTEQLEALAAAWAFYFTEESE